MALRFWRGTGDGNWGNTNNWSATSGGATGASVPTNADDVTFDSAGNNPCTINASARSCKTLTITSGYTSTITHTFGLTVAGSITFNNSHTIAGTAGLNISATGTVTMNGQTWPNTFGITAASVTVTLVGNFVCNGAFISSGGSAVINRTTTETFTCGGLTMTQAISGTAKIILTAGTWSGSGTVFNSLDLQGNITISGTVGYSTGTLTYVSGTITVTSSTLNLVGSCTLVGGTYNNITCSNTSGFTYTINTTTVVVNGTLTIGTGASTTFAGTAGFTCSTLLNQSTAATTVTLKDGVTYRINTALTCFTTRVGLILTFTSSSGTLKALMILSNPATCNCLASFTRIDASGGRTINTFNGTITDCNNIRAFNDLSTVSSGL